MKYTLAASLFLLPTLALAQTCPPGAKSCKIVILTPEEEQALTGPNAILQTAEQGRYVDLAKAVQYFREKLEKTPVTYPAPPKVEEKKENKP